MTMPPHNILIIVDLNGLAEPRVENFVYCFPTQVSHGTPKKKEKKKNCLSYLITQVTTWHLQKNFDGIPNMNCLASPLPNVLIYNTHVTLTTMFRVLNFVHLCF
jgi:hypothetical protein